MSDDTPSPLNNVITIDDERIKAGRQVAVVDADPPPLKWSDLRYVFDIQEDCNGKEAIQA